MAFPTGWSRKCAITVDNTQVSGTGTLTAFPICLTAANLPSEMLDKDGSFPAQMGGGDIRFTSDAAGSNKLPCHVIKFITHNTPASGEALIYVAADVAGTVDTTIYVWYNTATRIEQPKYNANTDADGFKGSDYTWANYLAMYQLGGFGGLRNLKQANASKGLGRYGTYSPRTYTVASNATGNDYVAFPSMVMVGERLYCLVREATDHTVVVSAELHVYVSDDMGQTWSEDTGLSITDASFDLRDPQLFLQSDGTLWAFYVKTNSGDTSRVCYYKKASAPYTSWGTETSFTTQTKANLGSKPIELASGRIVVPAYDIDGSANTAPFVRWTTDSGSTWTTDYLTATGEAPGTYGSDNEFSVAEDPTTAGNLVAICRRNAASNLYRYTSTDSGETWSSAAANIALSVANPDMPELLYCQDGDLLLAYAKHRTAPVYQISRSTDNGATWVTADFSYLWENASGSIGEPGGLTGYGAYISLVEMVKGLFCAVYFHSDATDATAKVFATHFSKIEDGALNVWLDTSQAIAATVGNGIELDDTQAWIGNGSLDYFNQVHQAGAFTISGWAKFNQVSDELHCFAGSSASSNDRGFFFGYENRTAASTPDALRLFVANGSGTSVNNQSAAITGDTSAHRFGVFCDAAGTPTFIKDQTTYSGGAALTNYAGDAELSTRIGGVANGAADLATGRLDGWMGMWGLSTVNLGADYEMTRYSSEVAPGTFAAAGTPAATASSEHTLAATATATASLAASVSPAHALAATATASPALAAQTSPLHALAGTATATAALPAQSAPAHTLAATASATADLPASAGPGSHTIAATATATSAMPASVSPAHTVTATASATFSLAAFVSPTHAIVAAGIATASLPASVGNSSHSMAAAATATASMAASVSPLHALSASATAVASVAASGNPAVPRTWLPRHILTVRPETRILRARP